MAAQLGAAGVCVQAGSTSVCVCTRGYVPLAPALSPPLRLGDTVTVLEVAEDRNRLVLETRLLVRSAAGDTCWAPISTFQSVTADHR